MTDRAQAIGREVAAAVGLLEGEAGVREVIGIVARLQPVGVRRISRAAELPVPIVSAICGELRKRGIVARERPVQLTPLATEVFDLAAGGAPSAVCSRCEGHGLEPGGDLAAVSEELIRIADAAPAARVEIDQSHCTVATKIRRVLLMAEAGALAGKRVLILGDDDLTSIAIHRVASHYSTATAIREIAVVDVDPAVLAYCRRHLRDAPFPTTFVERDLRRPLNDDLTDRFDSVFTDPPYTPEGAELFLSRASEALSPAGRGDVFFCAGMKPPRESLRIQQAIGGMGFVIRAMMRNFNEYLGAGALAGTSHLYHLIATNEMRPLVQGPYEGRLYTGEHQSARRFMCKSCAAVETVGSEQWFTTVAQLKSHGCPRCGGSVFRPLPRANPVAPKI